MKMWRCISFPMPVKMSRHCLCSDPVHLKIEGKHKPFVHLICFRFRRMHVGSVSRGEPQLMFNKTRVDAIGSVLASWPCHQTSSGWSKFALEDVSMPIFSANLPQQKVVESNDASEVTTYQRHGSHMECLVVCSCADTNHIMSVAFLEAIICVLGCFAMRVFHTTLETNTLSNMWRCIC